MRHSLLVALTVILFPLAAPAAIVIDRFDDAGSALANSGAAVISNITSGAMLGGRRLMQAAWLSGGGDVTLEVDFNGNGDYGLVIDSGTTGLSNAIYDGAGGGGLGGVDLTDGGTLDAIRVGVRLNDTDTTATLQMKDLDGDTATLIKTIPSGATGLTPVTFRYADMSHAPGPVDFTAIDRVAFVFEPESDGSTLRLEVIGAVDLAADNPVPALGRPGLVALGMALLGAAGLALRRGRAAVPGL
jgi:hypothetical protein